MRQAQSRPRDGAARAAGRDGGSREAANGAQRQDGGRVALDTGVQAPAAPERPFSIVDLPNDPATRLERDALQAMLQYPAEVGDDLLRHALDCRFTNASLAVVRDGIASVLASGDALLRVDRVVAEVPAPFAGVVHQLAVAPIPQRGNAELTVYVQGVVSALIDRELLRQKSELLGRLQRTDRADVETYAALQRGLVELERERRALRDE